MWSENCFKLTDNIQYIRFACHGYFSNWPEVSDKSYFFQYFIFIPAVTFPV